MPARTNLFVDIVIFIWKEFPMRRINNYSINKESTEDMIKAGRFNPSLEIIFRDRSGQYTHKFATG